MPKTREKYVVAGVDLYHVRNRNELRVIQELETLVQNQQLSPDPQSIRDAYAYALNNLPPRYTQQGTIVLRDPVKKKSLEDVVAASLDYVIKNPKSS